MLRKRRGSVGTAGGTTGIDSTAISFPLLALTSTVRVAAGARRPAERLTRTANNRGTTKLRGSGRAPSALPEDSLPYGLLTRQESSAAADAFACRRDRPGSAAGPVAGPGPLSLSM